MSTQAATPTTARDVAASALGVDAACLTVVQRVLGSADFLALGHRLEAEVAAGRFELLGGCDDGSPPRRAVLETASGESLALCAATLLVPAGEIGEHAVVLRVYQPRWGCVVELFADLTHTRSATLALGAYLEQTTGTASPYRGGAYRALGTHQGVHLEPTTIVRGSRDELMLPPSTWATVDRLVHGAIDLAEVLAIEGLSSSTGVLCVGPPGTGKSHLARVVASEVADRATVLIPNASAARHRIADVLRLAGRLAPSLVIIDDLDLVVGSRRGGGESVDLQDFLTSMDEVMAAGRGVVVMASTNAPDAIDPAAVRASRFDAVVTMEAPVTEARERILRRHLSRFPELDFTRLARLTDGATGADLRDLARRVYLETGGELTTEAVADAAAGRCSAPVGVGAYL